jgi:phage shock protein C
MAVQMPSRLYRSRSQKMIAGVAGGLGEYFDVDPVLIRLLFVVTAFISGAGILAYIVLWIVIPVEGDETPRLDALRRDFDDLSSRVRERIDPSRPESESAAASDAAPSATAPDAEPVPDQPPPPYEAPADLGPAAAPLGVDRRRRRQHWAGAMLIVIGLLVLGNNLGLLWWAQARFVVPLVIVGAGAWLLFGMSRRG